MNGRQLALATLFAAVLLTVLFTPVAHQQGDGMYDPWLDYNDDGIIDAYDLSSLGDAYGTLGDTTKNVNVKNWPVSTAVTVWFDEVVTYPDYLHGPAYNASGFSHLHILVDTDLIGEEKIVWGCMGWFYNSAHTDSRSVPAYVNTLISSNRTHSVTIPVPTETFAFAAYPEAGTSCSFSLSFYLTWA